MLRYILLVLFIVTGMFLMVNAAHANQYIDSEIKCMADNIYFEARNESVKGQVAVALVTLNRVDSPYYPDYICDVVWEHKQFSWTIDGKSDKAREGKAYNRAELIATILINARYINEDFNDITEGATHYHASYITPYWSSNMKYIAQIDNHIFYRFKK